MAAENVMHQMDDRHEQTLKMLLKIGDDKKLPDDLQRIYWRFRHLADRLSYHIQDGDLIRFVLEAKREPGVERPYSFLDVAREQGVELDAHVEVKWRGGEWVGGTFKGWRGREVLVVLHDGTAEMRSFEHTEVRLPEEVKHNG